jgi:hypothetical protein
MNTCYITAVCSAFSVCSCKTSAMKQETLVALLYGSVAIRHLFRTSNTFGRLKGRTHEIFIIPSRNAKRTCLFKVNATARIAYVVQGFI